MCVRQKKKTEARPHAQGRDAIVGALSAEMVHIENSHKHNRYMRTHFLKKKTGGFILRGGCDRRSSVSYDSVAHFWEGCYGYAGTPGVGTYEKG